MDFNYSEEQDAVRQLAGQIFGDRSTHERLKQIEAAAGDDGPFDRELWKELADAGLLGIHLGEDVGGAGLDFVAACLVVEAAGRTAAYVPVVESMIYGALPIDRFGTDAQRKTWLTGVANGETILTAAMAELVGEMILPGGSEPATTATAEAEADGDWVLSGTKACVPAAFVADVILVPATCQTTDGITTGPGVFIVERAADGVVLTRQTTTTGRPEAIVELNGVRVGADRLVGDGADRGAVIDCITEFATTALCIEEAGACASALELTAEYTKTRVQFEKPIATFQAVGQRAADAYVDTEAIRLTAWQAAARLAAGLPAASEVAIAKYWAAEGGQRVVHAASHLHGGVGVDRDYPLHRYFLLTRQIELTLGGANESLRRLGRILAVEPV
jgi:alkylation response protein AidB-like acyl-CoA dehydrogenase